MIKFDSHDQAVEYAQANAEVTGEFIDFVGYNCDEDECAGWDGLDDRCDCRNRRVYWETTRDENGKYVAFACAN